MVDMSKMPPRFKDQDLIHQYKIECHWMKTNKLLEKMGFVRRPRYDRMLLEELGLANLLDEEDEEEDYID